MTILALLLIWLAIDAFILVAISAYRSGLEQSVSERHIATIYQRSGRLVLRRRP